MTTLTTCKHFHYSIGGTELLCWEWSRLPWETDVLSEAVAWFFTFWPQRVRASA